MKKNTVKAFTLVEMLIVIVIIGILIAALLPRMQAAQGRARDVSRKTALSQIQSAIVVSQGDKGEWPGEKGVTCDDSDDENCTPVDSATEGIGVNSISKELKSAGMNSIPVDPLKSKVTGIGSYSGDDNGNYGYIITTRNGTEKGGFALMAKTEVEGGSNWVVCDGVGKITSETDIAKKDFVLCSTITKDENADSCSNDNGNCVYTEDGQLRYLLVY